MATITVTTLADSTATDGQVSLREAIQAANTNASVDGSVAGSGGTPDTIVFDPTVFTGGATNLIRLTLGEIAITEAVTIDGSTVGGVTITGDKDDDDVTLAGTDITDVAASGAALLDDNSRIFYIAGAADTTLQGLTLTGGRTTASGGGGGGVLSQSALTLTNSTVSGNSTTGFSAKGGGIAGDIVTLTDSTVSGNSTAGTFADGGGIMASNTVTLTNSTVSGNATTGSQAFGGGILASTVELTNSTVSGNSTAGIFSTGGGIHAGTVELTNSTVSGNSTAGFAADGGGVFSLTAVTLTNAIVLGNNSAQTTSDEISGAITANGLNIVGTGADTDASDHIINADPVLVFAQTVANGATMAGVLASNGGPVPTIALKLDAANPALDASNTSAPGTDARGLGYVDQPAITNANGSPADLGAFEAGELPSLVVTTKDDVVDARDGLTSLREAVAYANSHAGADTITFDPTTFTGGVTNLIRLTLGEIAISGAVTVDGSTVGGVTITGDKDDDDVTLAGTDITDVAASGAALLDDNSRIFNIATGADTTLQGLTLTGGRTTTTNERGGAIQSQATLTLIDSTVSGNSTSGFGARGGGIFGTAVTLTNSTVSGNSTSAFGADGGGIYGSNLVTLTNSTVSGNATTGDGAFGGGIYGNSIVTLTNSTVSGNFTAGTGAIGGGIVGINAVTLTNSTVSGNATTGSQAEGGGIVSANAVTLTNSIVLGNDSAQAAFDEIRGSVLANGLNIVGTGSDTDASDHVINADPTLVFAQTTANGTATAGVLANNGGPVRTIALKLDAANPALDASNASAPGADARGLGYVDQPAITNANGSPADLGAFEAGELPSLVVTTKDDVVDARDGLTSLREAVAYANSHAGADTITFDPTVFTGGATNLIRLTLGEIAISDLVTIDGAAVGGVTITGDKNDDDVTLAGTDITNVAASGAAHLADNSRIFNIALSAATTLQGLTLTGGRTTASGGDGGGVLSQSPLTLIDSTVSGNSTTAVDADGGGVLSNSTVTLINSTVSGNSTTGYGADGGGVYGETVTLTDSTVSGNSTAGVDAYGGGIFGIAVTLTNSTVSRNAAMRAGLGGGIYGDNVTLTDSTVSGNSADAYGGGIFVASTVTLTNSTVSGNSVTGDFGSGGGIAGVGTVTLINSTVSGNSVTGYGGQGGGIFSLATVTLTNSTVSGNATTGLAADGGGISSLTNVTLTNAIVLGNYSADTTTDEISGAVTGNGLNIVGSGADTDASDHVINADPTLVFAETTANGTATAGVLADNGGPVHTIALKLDATNPALDASNASAPVTDARGLGRVDQSAIANANGSPADLGAFELQGTINVAPTLGSGTLAAIGEDTANPPGQTPTAMFAGQFTDGNAGDTLAGIVVVGNAANTATEGVWQYSTDSGTSWFNIGSVNDATLGLALGAGTLVRFLPVTDYNGTPTGLSVRGLDSSYGGSFTSGSARLTLDTTAPGGLTPLSGNVAALATGITPVNDAPVNTVPGTQEIQANTATAIVGLSTTDPDAGGGALTTTLSVAHGTLTVAALGGATVGGSGTGTVTLGGTVAQINATLAGNNVVYKGAHDFFGTDALTVSTNDNGNTGSGGPLSDADSVTLNINTLITGTSGNDSYNALPGQERIDAGLGIDTITFGFKLVDASVTYEGNKVIIDGPTGSHTVLTGFEVFAFTDGTVNNNDGSPLVDDLFYYAKYHDVWNAHADADAHYNSVGWHEGRDPDAFFSTVIYLSANPDVKAAGLNPLTHFDTGGWKEGRVPSITFDPAAYLAANPDVAAGNVDPLRHYLAFGYQEGRQPIAPSELIGATGFDYVYYLQHNPDVAAANVDPFQHFQQFGWKEGRDPSALFDVDGYLNAYADVKAANVNPLDHYNQFGWHEGRDPSVGFDTTSYLAAYADIAAANINPLTHFLHYGIHEGRSAFADGVWG